MLKEVNLIFIEVDFSLKKVDFGALDLCKIFASEFGSKLGFMRGFQKGITLGGRSSRSDN